MPDTAFNLKGTLVCDVMVDDKPLVGEIQDGGFTNMEALKDATNSSTDSLKTNTAILKEFGDVMPEIIKNLRYMNAVVAQTGQSLPAVRRALTDREKLEERLAGNRERGLTTFVNTGGNMITQYANGNLGGMAGSLVSGSQNLIGNLRDSAKAADNKEMFGLLGKIGVGAAIAGVAVKVADTLSSKYIDEMPTIYGTGRAFGSLSDENALMSYDKINAYNHGTNLNTQGFNEIAVALRKQGVGNGLGYDQQIDLAGSIAQTTARWAYATGGDASQYANLAGLMSRYGGSSNVAEDFNRIVSSGYASGLNDTQIPEFLSGIQKVMEDGIAKGFTRSATEVADTLLMFSRMSGGDVFWQGEKGASLLNQANASISNATGLSKTEDLLIYSAFRKAYSGKDLSDKKYLGDNYVANSDYVNTMQMIEQGITPENFGAIMDSLSVYGNDNDAKIEALRKMTGLNYTGAARLFSLNTSNKDFATELDKVMKAPENQNNETQYQDAMNQIKQHVVRMGEGIAELKIAGMDLVVSGMNKITNWMGLGDGDKIFTDEPMVDNALFGDSAEGAWYLDDGVSGKSTFRAFIGHPGEKGYRDMITNELGAGSYTNEFIDYLYEYKDKKGTFNKEVEWKTSDSMVTTEEQKDIADRIKEIFELWKQEFGKPIILQEDSSGKKG